VHEIRSVLLVEDNEQNRELVEYLLGEAGLRVVSAANAASALEVVRREPVDLILLDMRIPGSEGVDLVGDLRAASGRSRPIIVALTAHAMRGDRERFLAAGCDEYIAKPIETSTFVDRLRSLVLRLGRTRGTD